MERLGKIRGVLGIWDRGQYDCRLMGPALRSLVAARSVRKSTYSTAKGWNLNSLQGSKRRGSR